MKTMKAKFAFFKAGQGSFYGGRIQSSEKVFTVVYDCGTSHFIAGNSQSLNKEIDTFKSNPHYYSNSNDIDLLFISHLDYDHVSGLKRMLIEFNVKKIVLPYIGKKNRQFYLTSISLEGSSNDNDLSLADYISFIESPNQFIRENSTETQIFFIKPNAKEIEYQGENDNESEDIYPIGTLVIEDEVADEQNVFVYDNDLQFFIQKKWEFTTYVKSVNDASIEKLHNCLKKKLNKNESEDLTLEDLKEIVTNKRKEAHKCYTKFIGEINSHGLVLFHSPINFKSGAIKIYPNCELNPFYHDYLNFFFYNFQYKKYNPKMLGTFLLGDTSINLTNNPIDLPQAFIDKLVDVYIVQVPHHGASANWNFDEFKKLITNYDNIVPVCNFGYGNTYGHPSHEVLNDLNPTLFLNSQFSRLNIDYEIIH